MTAGSSCPAPWLRRRRECALDWETALELFGPGASLNSVTALVLAIIAPFFIAYELVGLPVLNEGLLSVADPFLNAPLQSVPMLDVLHLLSSVAVCHVGGALLTHRGPHVSNVTVLVYGADFLATWFQLACLVLLLALERLLDELVFQDADRFVTLAFLAIHANGVLGLLERLGRLPILKYSLAPLLRNSK